MLRYRGATSGRLRWAGSELGVRGFFMSEEAHMILRHVSASLKPFNHEILEDVGMILSTEGFADIDHFKNICDIATKENRDLVEVAVEQIKLFRKLTESP